MANAKTHDQFVKDVNQKYGNIYEFFTEYKNSTTKIKTRHIECDHIWDVLPHALLSKNKNKFVCPNCNGGIKYTTEKFKEQVYSAEENKYVVLGEYIDAHTPISILHNIPECMHTYSSNPNNFNNGSRCPKCFGSFKRTTDQFKQEVYDLVKNEYMVLGKYETNQTKIKMEHTTCGFIWSVRPAHFLYEGSRCPKCAGVIKKTTEDFKQIVYELEGEDYQVLSEYVDVKTHILIKHIPCNHSYSVRPNNFLRGRRCPKCISSKGELTIANWLDENKINYIPQYKTEKCKDKKCLPFDFAVLNDCGDVIYLIEFDGGQHYKPVEFWGGDKGFKELQKRDRIKDEYSLKNNVPLLRIPYWDFDNISSILNNHILKECKKDGIHS